MRDRSLGIAIAVAGVAMVVATVVVAGGFLVDRHPLSVTGLGFALVGGLLVYRTGHRIGWITATTGLLFVANGLLAEMPTSPTVDRLLVFAWSGSIFASGILVFWFPTGRAVSPRWTWTLWVAVTAFVVGTVLVWEESLAIVGGFVVIAAVSLVVRYLRSTGTVRQQIKWFTFAVFAVAFLQLLWELTEAWLPLPQIVWELALAVALLMVPVSIGVAILRFRLYEIDRLVSRTVTYIAVVGILALLFVVLTLLPWILVIGVGSTRSAPPFVIAGATLVAAALFNPLRKRVQRRVDRRFNRSHYDASAVAEKFGENLRDTHDLDEIVSGLISVVSTTLSPTSVTAWARTREP